MGCDVINEATGGPPAALIDRGEQRGCLDLSEVDELAQALELEEDDLGELYEQLDTRGIELRDDCGRDPSLPGRRGRRSPPPRPTRCSSSSTRSAATGC